MKEKRKRNIILKFYVYPEEKMLIETKMKIGKFSSMSAYLRQVAVYEKIIINDMSEIKKMNSELNKIGVNINQLVARVNSTSTVYKEDVDYIKRTLEKIQHIQNSALTKNRWIR